MASQMIAVAVGWQMYEVTRSALALGFIGLAQFLPLLSLVFVTGHVADRFDRRRVARACELVEATAVIVLCVTTVFHPPSPALIYGMVVLLGIGRAFETPANFALLPNVVPPEIIAAASARVSTFQQVSTIMGPALAGLLYAWHSAIPYGIAGAMYLIAALMNTLMRTRGQSVTTSGPVTRASIFAGLQFIRGNPIVLGAISLDLFAVLLGGATGLLPVFARDVLGVGPQGFGVLRAAPAVGALLVAGFLSRRPIRRRAGIKMLLAVGLYGLLTVVFAYSRSVPLSVFALAALGGADMVSVFTRQSLVQIATPDRMRGRVAAVSTLFIGASNELGEFESGVVTRVLGPIGAVATGGVGAMVVTAVWAWLFPPLREADRLA